MNRLLFVILLGLLAGLVLFVVVVGVGALFNAMLNRIPAKGTKRARKSLPKNVQNETGVEPEPEPEMQLAAAAPIVSAQEQTERPEPAPATAHAARFFPKRSAKAEEARLEVVEPESAANEPEAAALVEPEEAPVAVAAAVTALEAHPRRKFPRPHFKPASEAPAAAQEPMEPAEELEAQAEPEASQQPGADAVDPFAAVMAALNKR